MEDEQQNQYNNYEYYNSDASEFTDYYISDSTTNSQVGSGGSSTITTMRNDVSDGGGNGGGGGGAELVVLRTWELNDNSTWYERLIATPSNNDMQIMWFGWFIVSVIVTVIILVVFVGVISKRKTLIKNPFNLYMIFLMIPDMILTIPCGITCLLNGLNIIISSHKQQQQQQHYSFDSNQFSCQLQSFYAVFGITANAWLNGVTCYQLYNMLLVTKQCTTRYVPPKLSMAMKQIVCVYLWSIFVASWGIIGQHTSWLPHQTLPLQGTACLPINYDKSSTIFYFVIFLPSLMGIPLLYAMYVTYQIYKHRLLPKSGNRRLLSIYFLRLAAVFFMMWLPGILLMFVFAPWFSKHWLLFIGGLLAHLQGGVSAAVSLYKPDVYNAVRDFWTCRRRNNNSNNGSTTTITSTTRIRDDNDNNDIDSNKKKLLLCCQRRQSCLNMMQLVPWYRKSNDTLEGKKGHPDCPTPIQSSIAIDDYDNEDDQYDIEMDATNDNNNHSKNKTILSSPAQLDVNISSDIHYIMASLSRNTSTTCSEVQVPVVQLGGGGDSKSVVAATSGTAVVEGESAAVIVPGGEGGGEQGDMTTATTTATTAASTTYDNPNIAQMNNGDDNNRNDGDGTVKGTNLLGATGSSSSTSDDISRILNSENVQSVEGDEIEGGTSCLDEHGSVPQSSWSPVQEMLENTLELVRSELSDTASDNEATESSSQGVRGRGGGVETSVGGGDPSIFSQQQQQLRALESVSHALTTTRELVSRIHHQRDTTAEQRRHQNNGIPQAQFMNPNLGRSTFPPSSFHFPTTTTAAAVGGGGGCRALAVPPPTAISPALPPLPHDHIFGELTTSQSYGEQARNGRILQILDDVLGIISSEVESIATDSGSVSSRSIRSRSSSIETALEETLDIVNTLMSTPQQQGRRRSAPRPQGTISSQRGRATTSVPRNLESTRRVEVSTLSSTIVEEEEQENQDQENQ